MINKFYVIDFETFYDSNYSLAKMGYEEYVNHEKFQPLCISLREYHRDISSPQDAEVSALDSAKAIERMAARIDYLNESGYGFVAHNMSFDGYIVHRLFGINLKYPVCTQAMMRWTGLAKLCGQSLASLAEAFNLPAKGTVRESMLGRTAESLSAEERAALLAYCHHDTKLTLRAFERLLKLVPDEALDMIAMTQRMYICPELLLDSKLLDAYITKLQEQQERDKEKLQKLFNFEDKEDFLKAIRSKRFPQLLEQLGATVPLKISTARMQARAAAFEDVERYSAPGAAVPPKATLLKLRKALTQPLEIPALAKTDEGFQALLTHPDPNVSLLAHVRLDNNSSLSLSRALRFKAICDRGVALPIQLNAFQALTGRYTAGVGDVSSNKSDGLNFQNLPKHGDTSLRRSIIAPPGYVLIGGDSSQIECRVLAWLSGQMDLVELFRNHGDPYSDFAETLSGIPAAEIYHGAKVTHDPKLYEWRDIAKRLILGSGYGLGGARQAKLLRHKNIKLAPTWDEHEQKAIEYTHIYRTRFPSIKLFWKTCDQVLYGLTTQCQDYFTPAKIRIDFAYSIIARIGYTQPALILPNKFPIIYPDLRFDSASGNYSYKIWVKKKEVERSIYGAQVTAHVTQGLAFALLWWQGLRINERYKVIGNVHDSWIALVPEEEAVEAREYIYECLTTLPDWLVGLPIDAEVNIGHTYDVA